MTIFFLIATCLYDAHLHNLKIEITKGSRERERERWRRESLAIWKNKNKNVGLAPSNN